MLPRVSATLLAAYRKVACILVCGCAPTDEDAPYTRPNQGPPRWERMRGSWTEYLVHGSTIGSVLPGSPASTFRLLCSLLRGPPQLLSYCVVQPSCTRACMHACM